MKTTFIILACLVFLAATAWAEEDETAIADRILLPGLTDDEQTCVDAKLKGNKKLQLAIAACISSDPRASKKGSCIRKISALKACLSK